MDTLVIVADLFLMLLSIVLIMGVWFFLLPLVIIVSLSAILKDNKRSLVWIASLSFLFIYTIDIWFFDACHYRAELNVLQIIYGVAHCFFFLSLSYLVSSFLENWIKSKEKFKSTYIFEHLFFCDVYCGWLVSNLSLL